MRIIEGSRGRLLWLLSMVLLFGCGGNDEYSVVPVSGVVTCQGKPVANATVNFSAKASEDRSAENPGRPAMGITDAQGNFRLTTYENNDGALRGTHRVTVQMNMNEDTGVVPRFPCRDKELEITIEKATSDLKVDF